MVQDRLLAALTDIEDPELGCGIVELGLLRRIDVQPERVVIVLTTTSPACPMGQHIADEVLAAARAAAPGVAQISVEIERSPPWTPAEMSPDLRQMFGWDP